MKQDLFFVLYFNTNLTAITEAISTKPLQAQTPNLCLLILTWAPHSKLGKEPMNNTIGKSSEDS